jgi:hypothetical protein
VILTLFEAAVAVDPSPLAAVSTVGDDVGIRVVGGDGSGVAVGNGRGVAVTTGWGDTRVGVVAWLVVGPHPARTTVIKTMMQKAVLVIF